jgi:prepilin peptidase CpaA
MISTLSIVALVSALGVAAWTDVRSRRIPNALTVTLFAAALLLRALSGGGMLVEGLLGAGLALLVVLPLFAVRGVGGGDAKLLIAAGAVLGPAGFLYALLFTAVAGGALALYAAVRGGALLPVLFNTGDLIKYWLSFGRRGQRSSLATPGILSVPYGVAIGLGCVAALFVRGGL